MEKYNYYRAVMDDVAEYVEDNHIDLDEYGDDIDEVLEKLEDEVWDEDCITGNGGMYYDTTEKCEEYICHNLDLLLHAVDEFDFKLDYRKMDSDLAKILDSIIRCYVLPQAIYDYLKENWNDSTATD